MRLVKPVPVAHKYKRRAFVFKYLNSCSHSFLRDHARKALERPYTGPHKILNRISDRVYEIEINGVSRHVSIENIKPAYFLRDDINHLELPANSGNHSLNTEHKPKTYTRKM